MYLQIIIETVRPAWWVGVAGGLAIAAIALSWLFLPPVVERFYQWVDDLVPADLSAFKKSTSRFLVFLLSVVILAAAGLFIANTFGVNTSAVEAAIKRAALNAGLWLLPRLLRIGGIVLISMFAVRIIRRLLPGVIRKGLAQRKGSEPETELKKRTETLERVLTQSAVFLVAIAAFFMIISELDVNIAPLLAGAGIAGIAIGFGAQNLVRDIFSGIFIMLDDEYRVGDVVRVAGISGLVEDFNLRRTVLRDLDYIVHVIPNGEIRMSSNFTKEKSRVNLNIEVAYKEDLDHCIEILNRIGREMKEDPKWGPLMNEPLYALRVDNFGESGIAIKVLGETKPIQQWAVAGEYRLRVKKAFDAEGIEIPFPHRTIYWGTDVETRIRQVSDERTTSKAQRAGANSPKFTEEGTKTKGEVPERETAMKEALHVDKEESSGADDGEVG
ncbi:MAG: mechanosensitive ion channel family protein [Chloroflexi bacterium]|nr:mechanosensitive ion channel family protein [Chloroflexota bacterium]